MKTPINKINCSMRLLKFTIFPKTIYLGTGTNILIYFFIIYLLMNFTHFFSASLMKENICGVRIKK